MKKLLIILIIAFLIAGCQDMEQTSPETLSKFMEFADNPELQYTATYDISSQGRNYQMRQYFKDENTVRTDVMLGAQQAQTYMLDQEVFSCAKQDEWVCIRIEGEMMENLQEAAKAIEENPEQFYIIYLGKEEIADADGYCFEIEAPELLGMKFKECFSVEGIPLYLKTGSLIEMKATSFKAEVDDVDFKLPAEPKSLEELKQ